MVVSAKGRVKGQLTYTPIPLESLHDDAAAPAWLLLHPRGDFWQSPCPRAREPEAASADASYAVREGLKIGLLVASSSGVLVKLLKRLK